MTRADDTARPEVVHDELGRDVNEPDDTIPAVTLVLTARQAHLLGLVVSSMGWPSAVEDTMTALSTIVERARSAGPDARVLSPFERGIVAQALDRLRGDCAAVVDLDSEGAGASELATIHRRGRTARELHAAFGGFANSDALPIITISEPAEKGPTGQQGTAGQGNAGPATFRDGTHMTDAPWSPSGGL